MTSTQNKTNKMAVLFCPRSSGNPHLITSWDSKIKVWSYVIQMQLTQNRTSYCPPNSHQNPCMQIRSRPLGFHRLWLCRRVWVGWRENENSMMSAQPACSRFSASPGCHFRPWATISRRAASNRSRLSIMRDGREPQQWAAWYLSQPKNKQHSLLKSQTMNKTLQAIMKNI